MLNKKEGFISLHQGLIVGILLISVALISGAFIIKSSLTKAAVSYSISIDPVLKDNKKPISVSNDGTSIILGSFNDISKIKVTAVSLSAFDNKSVYLTLNGARNDSVDKVSYFNTKTKQTIYAVWNKLDFSSPRSSAEYDTYEIVAYALDTGKIINPQAKNKKDIPKVLQTSKKLEIKVEKPAYSILEVNGGEADVKVSCDKLSNGSIICGSVDLYAERTGADGVTIGDDTKTEVNLFIEFNSTVDPNWKDVSFGRGVVECKKSNCVFDIASFELPAPGSYYFHSCIMGETFPKKCGKTISVNAVYLGEKPMVKSALLEPSGAVLSDGDTLTITIEFSDDGGISDNFEIEYAHNNSNNWMKADWLKRASSTSECNNKKTCVVVWSGKFKSIGEKKDKYGIYNLRITFEDNGQQKNELVFNFVNEDALVVIMNFLQINPDMRNLLIYKMFEYGVARDQMIVLGKNIIEKNTLMAMFKSDPLLNKEGNDSNKAYVVTVLNDPKGTYDPETLFKYYLVANKAVINNLIFKDFLNQFVHVVIPQLEAANIGEITIDKGMDPATEVVKKTKNGGVVGKVKSLSWNTLILITSLTSDKAAEYLEKSPKYLEKAKEYFVVALDKYKKAKVVGPSVDLDNIEFESNLLSMEFLSVYHDATNSRQIASDYKLRALGVLTDNGQGEPVFKTPDNWYGKDSPYSDMDRAWIFTLKRRYIDTISLDPDASKQKSSKRTSMPAVDSEKLKEFYESNVAFGSDMFSSGQFAVPEVIDIGKLFGASFSN